MRGTLGIACRALIAPLGRSPTYFIATASFQWHQLRWKATRAKAAKPVKTAKPRKSKSKLETETETEIEIETPSAEKPPAPSATPELTTSAFALRDYQEECIRAVLSSHEQGHRRLGISLATGSGKTVIFTQLIDRIKPLRDHATQTLILVHRRELVEQAATHCRNRYPDKTIEIEMGTTHATGNADITIASVQSLVSGARILKFRPETHKLILIDEAHHSVAKSYRKTLEHFGAMTPDTDVYVVGVSATFARSDGLRLGAVMDHIVYHKDFVAMIDSGWLSKVMFTTVQSRVRLSDVKITGTNGDFNLSELATVVNTAENNDITVRSWAEKAGNRKSTLVFCVDIQHVIDMTNLFRRYGYEAFYVTGETPLKERTQILEDFKAGKFPILVNCGVFTEGTDIPNIDCVLLSRPTRSRTLLVQMIGRGMRLHPGKEDCHVIDVVGSIDKGVVTTPTLFGLSPDEVLDRATSNVVKNKFELQQGSQGQLGRQLQEGDQGLLVDDEPQEQVDPAIYSKPWSVTFVDYDSIHDLIEDKKGDLSIRQFSQNSWVWVGPGKYVLSMIDNSFVSIQAKPEGGFSVHETRALPDALKSSWNTPYMRPRVVVQHVDTLEGVVNAADTFVTGRYPRQLMRHDAAWRKTGASDGQLGFLAKRTKKSVEEYKQSGLTKGQAADMLTRMKHGAQGVFDKLAKMKRREERRELKALKMSTPMIEEIKIGRLDANL